MIYMITIPMLQVKKSFPLDCLCEIANQEFEHLEFPTSQQYNVH